MSRKAAIVEEFDDDTDLPLPSMPLPNTGTRGPVLQEINDDSDDDDFEPSSRAGPASPPRQQPFSGGQQQRAGVGPDGVPRVTDVTPYKSWTCIYPIYVDAKRPYGTGQRRVSRDKSVWWPLSKDIADAANRLGLGCLHEVNKSHPRDWDNPGRVRIQWKKDGKLVNSAVKSKKHLLEMICFYLQTIKPENVPKPPYTLGSVPIPAPLSQGALETSPSPSASGTPRANTPTPAASAQKGKASTAKSKGPSGSSAAASHHTKVTDASKSKPSKRQLPIPPEPYPLFSSRLSPYSPALASGMLIETVKAGMNAQPDPALPGAGPAAPPGNMAKGKRKVVRGRFLVRLGRAVRGWERCRGCTVVWGRFRA